MMGTGLICHFMKELDLMSYIELPSKPQHDTFQKVKNPPRHWYHTTPQVPYYILIHYEYQHKKKNTFILDLVWNKLVKKSSYLKPCTLIRSSHR